MPTRDLLFQFSCLVEALKLIYKENDFYPNFSEKYCILSLLVPTRFCQKKKKRKNQILINEVTSQ